MPIFVHLAPKSKTALIRRNGINRMRVGHHGHPSGIFAIPVTRNFYLTHQWLRELKRRGQGPLDGVYFRIADTESVWIGHYAQPHQQVTAAVAAAMYSNPDEHLGWEIVIPRRINPNEIHRIRALPQIIGWRYSPFAKGKKPYCTCRFCIGGDFGARKLRARLGTPD